MAHKIFQTLRADIIEGRRKPGERLGESRLATQFDVSRGPIRDALRQLLSVGLVTFVPNVGVRVRELTRHDVRTLYELREALEADAARLAATRASPIDGRSLVDLLDSHESSVARHPAGAYRQGEGRDDFHTRIALLSGNAMFYRLLAEELYPQLALLRRSHSHVEGRGRVALQEHRRITQAIVAGDSEVAAILMRRHIHESWQTLEQQLTD